MAMVDTTYDSHYPVKFWMDQLMAMVDTTYDSHYPVKFWLVHANGNGRYNL